MSDIELKEESEGPLERNNVKEFDSDKKSDGSNEDLIQFDSSKFVRESSESFVVVSPEMKIEDNGVGYRGEISPSTHCVTNYWLSSAN